MKQCLLYAIILFSLSQQALAALNINTASKTDLETLSGIGPTKAQAILDYRKKIGTFKAIDELENVPGIGPATIATIKKDISLGDSAQSTVPKDALKAKKP